MKKVAILQSNYVPWKGYFDLINSVDEFVIYDTAQYTKNDWRNRNKIKTGQGISWLTVPVAAKGKSDQKIDEAVVSDQRWRKKHWSAISQSYSKCKFFNDYKHYFEKIFLEGLENKLSDINFRFMKLINEILGVTTKIHWSSDFELSIGKTDRLVNICCDLNAKIYLSGPSAKDYLDENLFEQEGMGVEWMDYSGYPEYEQQHGPFEHGVTVLDLIFNEGPNSTQFMKSFGNK